MNTNEPPQKYTITVGAPEADDVQKRDDVKFRSQIDAVIRDAEDLRMGYMKRQKTRKTITAFISVLSVLAGAFGFGFFFLMNSILFTGILCIIASFILPLLLPLWVKLPAAAYKRAYKRDFLPKMARALGGLSYHPARGISEKIVRKTGVLPAFDTYRAEDCFMGKYKGVKVLMSEARLHKKSIKTPVFDGVFVLMDIPAAIIEGHTIITADITAAAQYEQTRWRSLSRVSISLADTQAAQANRFAVYSDAPEAAGLMVGERLLKELAETSTVFKDSALSCVLFNKKYIFMAIPYAGDMFEPSDITEPVATKEHTETTKAEIDKLLEIIDVFELYDTAGF